MIYEDTQKICKSYVISIASEAQVAKYSRVLTSHCGGNNTMKRNTYLRLTLVGLLCGAGLIFTIRAQTPSSEKCAFTPDAIPYGPAPAFVAPGAQLAVIEGDPSAASGDFTVRLKMPDGYRIAPHWHPHRENVTVISGTFKVGMGDRFEENKMGSFPAGSFAYLDPNMHHYAMASGEVVVQVHGLSPLQFNYVNANDDPSRKK
jgi:mannose-6-phosphate isomerase-like protein (cupin superfamily)